VAKVALRVQDNVPLQASLVLTCRAILEVTDFRLQPPESLRDSNKWFTEDNTFS
jgi:hypothetical protein